MCANGLPVVLLQFLHILHNTKSCFGAKEMFTPGGSARRKKKSLSRASFEKTENTKLTRG